MRDEAALAEAEILKLRDAYAPHCTRTHHARYPVRAHQPRARASHTTHACTCAHPQARVHARMHRHTPLFWSQLLQLLSPSTHHPIQAANIAPPSPLPASPSSTSPCLTQGGGRGRPLTQHPRALKHPRLENQALRGRMRRARTSRDPRARGRRKRGLELSIRPLQADIEALRRVRYERGNEGAGTRGEWAGGREGDEGGDGRGESEDKGGGA
jgi:hypothetical protein